MLFWCSLQNWRWSEILCLRSQESFLQGSSEELSRGFRLILFPTDCTVSTNTPTYEGYILDLHTSEGILETDLTAAVPLLMPIRTLTSVCLQCNHITAKYAQGAHTVMLLGRCALKMQVSVPLFGCTWQTMEELFCIILWMKKSLEKGFFLSLIWF